MCLETQCNRRPQRRKCISHPDGVYSCSILLHHVPTKFLCPECLFSDSTRNTTFTQTKYYFLIDYRFLLIPKALSGLGATFIIPGSFELLVAQAPIEMRGIIVGLFYVANGLYEQIGWLLILPFKAFPSLWPSCEFYYLVLNLVVMMVSLVGVILVGKWYKLRQRDDPFNPYSAAENFYNKDFDRRDKYMHYGALDQTWLLSNLKYVNSIAYTCSSLSICMPCTLVKLYHCVSITWHISHLNQTSKHQRHRRDDFLDVLCLDCRCGALVWNHGDTEIGW